jgi:hypothetical protein
MWTFLFFIILGMPPPNYHDNRINNYFQINSFSNELKKIQLEKLPTGAEKIEQYKEIFGSPERFIENVQSKAKENLNEYLGIGAATTGFILIIKAFLK